MGKGRKMQRGRKEKWTERREEEKEGREGRGHDGHEKCGA